MTGTAEGSQIAGMEGLNHIKIYDSELSSSITDKTATPKTEEKPAAAEESPAETQPAPSTEAATETGTQQSSASWAVAGVIILAAFAGISAYLRKRK